MLVFDLVSLAEARALTFFLWPLLLCCLVVARDILACRHGKAEVLVFDLAAVAKALAQFEHSSEVVGLMLPSPALGGVLLRLWPI